MGLEFKLTDDDLPVSPVFVFFLANVIAGKPYEAEPWSLQRAETLAADTIDSQRLTDAVALVMGTPWGRDRLIDAYTLLFGLITGESAALQTLQARFHFINVIGIPRTGGSYLTAELYRALGMRPAQVPSGLAHDSFPEAGPFRLQSGANSWVVSLKTMAEYLTMVAIFFGARKPQYGKIVVPKKATKASYAGGFFQSVLGVSTEQILTVRHPAASCVSTYDKSGGLPADGRFAVRSNIEEWCRRDLESTGCTATQLAHMDYFDAYLRYWEQYHMSIALTGLSACRDLRVVAFDPLALQKTAQHYHDRYASGVTASSFQISDKARRLHPDWIARARPAIARIAAAWTIVGLPFPEDAIGQCW